jgi:hypothetical protein
MIALFIGTASADRVEVHEVQRTAGRPQLSIVGGTDLAKRALDKQIDAIPARRTAVAPGQKEFTVAQFCAARGAELTLSQMQTMGKAAAKYCRMQGLAIGRVDDELFGEVNAYCLQSLQAVSGMFITHELELA